MPPVQGRVGTAWTPLCSATHRTRTGKGHRQDLAGAGGVVGARGRLTGYAAGVDRKRALLALERSVAAVPPLIAERDGCGLLTLSPAELEGVVRAEVAKVAVGLAEAG